MGLLVYMSNNRRQRVKGEKSTPIQKKIPWHARSVLFERYLEEKNSFPHFYSLL